MAIRGAKPGERRGGRQKGTPNKITKSRAELIEEVRGTQPPKGTLLAKVVLAEAMMHFRGLAAKYHVNGATPDETKFHRYLKDAAAIAADLVPYESARLQATTISGNKDAPINAELVVRFV